LSFGFNVGPLFNHKAGAGIAERKRRTTIGTILLLDLTFFVFDEAAIEAK
jgi:hypothetical protein